MKTTYTNCRIVTDGKIFDKSSIVTENGKIIDIVANELVEGNVIKLDGNYIAPGFIDIHCHGGAGSEFIDGTEQAVKTACELHYSHGTRVIFPTVSATDYKTTVKSLEAVSKVKDKCKCIIPGVHLEGPYMSPSMVGGQAADSIRKPDVNEYTGLVEKFGNIISRWTYAPEEDDNDEFLKFIHSKGIIASVGHSSAEYKDMKSAFENGCNLVTHLYSCTSTITRHGGFRHLGIIESAFLLDDMYVEAIGDGKHLPLELLQMIVKIKGSERVCLITDSLRPGGAGKEDEGKVFDDCAVPFIIEDGVAKLPDRSAFAGSIATTDILLRTAVDAGISIPESVRMITQTPAEVMKLENFGRIATGYNAVFTVFDQNLNIINF